MTFESIFFVLIGLVGLFFGGNWLVKGAGRLASSFGVSPLVIGLTVVAFGTSLPELLVSLNAALDGVSDIAIGNVIGSNIANIGLIVGLTAIIFPIPVKIELIRRELPIMLAVSALLAMLIFDAEISVTDGLIFVTGALAYVIFSYVMAMREKGARKVITEFEEVEIGADQPNRLFEVGRLVVGIVVLLIGADRLVEGAVNIATAFGVPQVVIGLTLVAVGTSLPELATSFMASIHRDNDIAVGNVVGSNIFNILVILGVTALVKPIPVEPRLIQVELIVMLAFSVVLFVLVLDKKVTRWQGGLLLAAYLIFMLLTFAG